MTDTLDSVLHNPAFQTGIGILVKTRPEIGLALQLITSLVQGWHEQSELNVAIIAIDGMAAEHVKRLMLPNIHPLERAEIEVRLHELLTVLIKLGGL